MNERVVLSLTFLRGGPAPDWDRIGELAQCLYDAPAPFEGHLSRDHLLFSFPRGEEARLFASCAAFVSTLNYEARVHSGQLVDATTQQYARGRVHQYELSSPNLPAVVVSSAILNRITFDLGPTLLRCEGHVVIHPFAAARQYGTEAGSEWLEGCRAALSQVAASSALDCPRFDWLLEVLDETSEAFGVS